MFIFKDNSFSLIDGISGCFRKKYVKELQNFCLAKMFADFICHLIFRGQICTVHSQSQKKNVYHSLYRFQTVAQIEAEH